MIETYEKIPCLGNGIFARTTLKPLDSVFNFEEEKRKIAHLAINGEWFIVSGLRRTGKTTLVRSVCQQLDVIPVYINIWGIGEEDKEAYVLEKIVHEIRNKLKKYKLKSLLTRISKLSFLGASIEIRAQNQIRLEQALKDLVQRKRVIIILDEVQEIKEQEKFFKFLAALHDETAPNLSTIFLGSMISLKKLLEENYAKPLHGRLSEEIVLSPLKDYESRKMLRRGFEQCNAPVDEDFIREASYRLGGFSGWISHFGRIAVLEYYLNRRMNIEEIYEKLIIEAEKILYDEIARAISERRKLRNYLKILKYLGEHGEITVSEAARRINKKPNTALIYLNHLIQVGILTKIRKRYTVADPLIREILSKKDMEREIKLRL